MLDKIWFALILAVAMLINAASLKICWDTLYDLRVALAKCNQSAPVRSIPTFKRIER